jgi:hypothetical protein
MKGFIKVFLVAIIFFASITSVFARSGCCSSHQGVRADGCGCNDGTSLSSTCAPYYTCSAPQQNTAPASNNSTDTINTYAAPYIPPTDTPTLIPTNTPTPALTPTPTQKPIRKVVVKKHITPKPNKPKPILAPQKSWWQRLFGW